MVDEKILQPVAFILTPEFVANLPLDIYGLNFPTAWIPTLVGLQAEKAGRPDKLNRFQVSTLNGAIATFLPYLTTVPNSTVEKADAPWLLTAHPFSVAKVAQVFDGWLKETYRDCESFNSLRSLFKPEELGSWYKLPSTLFADKPIHPNNTANLNGWAYNALPTLIADLLVQQNTQIQVAGQQFPLIRVPSPRGAELITWSPAVQRDKKDISYFSYYIKITVQTVVGDSQPRIHFHFGVRRWISSPKIEDDKLYLDSKTARTVYIYRTRPWLDLPATNIFTTSSIRAGRDDTGKRIPVWDNGIPAIARALGIKLPALDDLLKNPPQWLTGDAQTGVAIAIPEKTPKNYLVGAGLGLEEHELLTDTIAQALQGQLELCATPRRLPKRNRVFTKPNYFPQMKDLREIPAEKRKEAMVWSVAAHPTIEVIYSSVAYRDRIVERLKNWLYGDKEPFADEADPGTGSRNEDEDSTEIVRTAVFSEISDIFDISEEDDDAAETDNTEVEPEQEIKSQRSKPRKRLPVPPAQPAKPDESIDLDHNGARLRIITRQLPEFGALLEVPEQSLSNKRQRGEYRKKATEERVRFIELNEPKAADDEPTLCIIELPNFRNQHETRVRDPKLAIRRGLAKCGKLTKFVSPDLEKDSEESIARKCDGVVKDGLRMLGYLPAPIGFEFREREEGKLPQGLWVAGLWRIRLTTKRAFAAIYLPVLVIVSADKFVPVMAWLPDGKGLRPYYRALLDITLLTTQEVAHNKEKEIKKQLSNLFQFDIPAQNIKNLVLLAVSQNIRRFLDDFTDKKVQFDVLTINGSSQPLKNLPYKLRIIRLRTNESAETPEWYVKGAKAGSHTTGVWQLPGLERVFFNIAEKPLTQKGGKKGKQAKPAESYAIPSIVEIAILGLQEGDDPAFWARAISQWRHMHYTFSGMTLLPLSLHWAKKMTSYAEAISPFILPDSWEEDADADSDIDDPDNIEDFEDSSADEGSGK